MSKLSVGTAVTAAEDGKPEQMIEELTVLEVGSKDSIYSLIFSETTRGSSVKDEQ